MGKNVLVLNGSPRANGNTAALLDEFIRGAESSGNTVTRFDIQKMNIHPCLGCWGGGKDPASPCAQKDDMAKIYPVYEKADILVLASPIYFWGITGQLKCVFDRLFAVAECNPDYENPVKTCMLLVVAEGTSQENFEPVLHYYHSLVKWLNWKDAGTLYAGGNTAPGDIKGKPDQLEAARKMGTSIH